MARNGRASQGVLRWLAVGAARVVLFGGGAALVVVLAMAAAALVTPMTASAATSYGYDGGAGARVHEFGAVVAGQRYRSADLGIGSDRTPVFAAGSSPSFGPSIATEAEGAGLSEAFHYTGSQNVASIEANGLRAGSYATPSGELSPLQAQIDLALPPNRGLPGATPRIDVAGLREAGYEIPEVTQVGRSHNMPGGGYEMQFGYPIPPEFIKAVP